MSLDRRRFIVSTSFAVASIGRGALAAESPPLPTAALRLDAHVRPSPDASAGGTLRLTYGDADPTVLRLKPGVATSVHVSNRLSEPTGLDWHGLRQPNALDLASGLGGMPIEPGGARDVTLTPGDTGTSWVHPPAVPGSADQTARGLLGVVIVEEPDAPPVDADLVLLLADGGAGPSLADRLTINGKPRPEAHTYAPGSRLRLRLVNGSTREAVAASFSGARPFVVAIDGQPSDLFQPLNNMVPIGPGARFDVLLDLPRIAGAEFTVTLQGAAAAPSSPAPPVYLARTDGPARSDLAQPIRPLTPNPALPRYIPLEHSVRATLEASAHPAGKPGDPDQWAVNGANGTVLTKKPLFGAKRGSPVTLALINRSPVLTAFRLHGHVMRLLHAKDDGWEPYWRDSVIVLPATTAHVAFVADNPGRWLIESPVFDQAAHGLRCWFEVT